MSERDVYEWLDPHEERERAENEHDQARHAWRAADRAERDAWDRVRNRLAATEQERDHWRNMFEQYVMKHAMLVPMPPILLSGKAIEHIDGDPTNNDLSNIRIVDVKANRGRP